MQIRIKSEDLQQILMEQELPEEYRCPTGLMERSQKINHGLIQGAFSETICDGIHLNIGRLGVTAPTRFYAEFDSETIEMHFHLSGASKFKMKGLAGEHQFSPMRHNIVYGPAFEGFMYLDSSCIQQSVEINFSPSFFERWHADLLFPGRFQNKIENRQMSKLSDQNRPITPTMERLLTEMIQCQRTGVYKKLFLESRVLELLMLQLEQFGDVDPITSGLNNKEEEKIREAQFMIGEHWDNPLTIRELAKALGINEFKLKRDFKTFSGKTIFNYTSDLRMGKARQMLLDTDMSITEISDTVGYKHSTHFAAAFRKRFGTNPKNFGLVRR